nr:hypothetical protein [Tanacetum cinerariifolium]
MDLDIADVSPQPSTEQLDEGFTATDYLNVQENLKLAVEEPIPESPKEHQQLKATITDTTTTTTTLPPPQVPLQSTTEAMMPPPLPPAGPSGASGAPRASGSAQMPPSLPPPSSTNQESPSKGSAAPSP